VTPDGHPELHSANGEMLHLLTRADRGAVYETLEAGAAGEPVWQRLLVTSAGRDVQALIDAGGLLAGRENRQAALNLLEINTRYQRLECCIETRFFAQCTHWAHVGMCTVSQVNRDYCMTGSRRWSFLTRVTTLGAYETAAAESGTGRHLLYLRRMRSF
jgi:hypothetical protein